MCICLCFGVTNVVAESNLVDIPADELLDVYLQDHENPSSSKKLEKKTDQATQRSVIYKPEAIVTTHEQPKQSKVTSIDTDENFSNDELEVIELENYDEEIVTIDADDSSTTKTPTKVATATTKKTIHEFCQKNPHAKECLYSNYLSRCEKNPRSPKCKDQLKKFEGFCKTFPRAYKCKKAQMAVTCSHKPELKECETFSKRYCKKSSNAAFCNWY